MKYAIKYRIQRDGIDANPILKISIIENDDNIVSTGYMSFDGNEFIIKNDRGTIISRPEPSGLFTNLTIKKLPDEIRLAMLYKMAELTIRITYDTWHYLNYAMNATSNHHTLFRYMEHVCKVFGNICYENNWYFAEYDESTK